MSQLSKILQKEHQYSEIYQSQLLINPKPNQQKFWIKKNLNKSLKYKKPFNSSISRKIFSELKLGRSGPGPGSYDPYIKLQPPPTQLKKKSPPLGGMMQRSSILDSTIQVPGPGSYQILSNDSTIISKTSPKIYRSMRHISKMKKNEIDDLPGPGQYQHKNSLSNIKYSHMFKDKTKFIRRQHPQSQLVTMIRKMANQQKKSDQLHKQQQQQTQVHKIKKKYFQRNSKQILRQIQSNNQQSNLGPGSYDLSFPNLNPHYYQFKNSACFVYKDQVKNKTKNNNIQPGPGSYDINTGLLLKQGHASSSFVSKQPRTNLQARNSSGPNVIVAKSNWQPKSFIYNINNKWI